MSRQPTSRTLDGTFKNAVVLAFAAIQRVVSVDGLLQILRELLLLFVAQVLEIFLLFPVRCRVKWPVQSGVALLSRPPPF